MCGINGIISRNHDKELLIKKMNDKIVHRGPDAEGIYADDLVALGHRRLSIIDVTDAGNQPIYNEDKSVLVVFNGEIYNFKELKEELTNHTFTTNTDTEVLVHGYEEWGKDLPKKLRGMFALAIYDKQNKEIFVARDHFGQKPFYYYKTDEEILFSSEIKSFLVCPSFVKELNKELLGAYLTFNFTPTDETFFKNVYRLPAAGCMTINVESLDMSVDKYFQVEFHDTGASYEEMVDKIEEAMKDSIKHHLISDVEIGSFLSSGIDSSYLVSLSRPDKTYTVGYDIAQYSEIEYAKDLTSRLGIQNITDKISKEAYMNALSSVFYHLDEPTGDPCTTAVYFLSELASRDVKVVLSGEGADEFFGGYNTYDDNFYTKLPLWIRKIIGAICTILPQNRYTKYLRRRAKSVEESYVGINRTFYDDELKDVLNFTDYLKNKDILADTYAAYKKDSKLNKMLAIDIKYWLTNNILAIADKMTMAFSLEARVPFTDVEVFKVSSNLPQNYKIRDGFTKASLREAAKRAIPNESYKKKKLGFPVPVRDWIREDDFYEEIKSVFDMDISHELFNHEYLTRLLDNHKNKVQDNYRKIWTIYSFLKWYEVFFVNNGEGFHS